MQQNWCEGRRQDPQAAWSLDHSFLLKVVTELQRFQERSDLAHADLERASQPGTLTFVFTDLEGSTRLLQQIGRAYTTVLEEHRRISREIFERWGGRLVDTAGDGHFLVFEGARDAFAAAVEVQRALTAHEWPPGAVVRVRMGLHTGEPVVSATGYVGLDVHRASRIAAASHGGQVVVSEATRQLIANDLPPNTGLRDLGEHWLKDLPRAERLYQAEGEGLPSGFPPLRSAGRGLSEHLPGRIARLIGREEELDAVRELLLRPEIRLVTLTGTGGTGKTSLALETAARCISEFRDGVAYVALAPISEFPLVFAAIAQTLAVTARGEQEVLAAVIEYLRGRQILLVLDNFEHVVDAATGIASIITSCPGVKVLVTSRFALRLSMEREFPLLPLRTPDFTVARTANTLRGYPAVELFAERAAAVRPGFHLDDESTVAVAEICQRLDGLPLAIELAAARIKLFSPRALLARLDRRLELLSGGARDLPARHQTLRQAIRWSYDLLEPGEQAAFRRLAVFTNRCSLETADTVCTAAGEPLLPTLEAVAALVDKSLLRQQTGEDNEPRFFMLETVREFALEELVASSEETITRNAHADIFIALAESAAPRLAGPEQQQWLPRLEREHDDLRAAFDWAIRSEDPARALRLGAALCRFWIIRGFHTEGRQRLKSALALPGGSRDEGLCARVLQGAAILAFEQSELDEASEMLERALEHFRAAEDTRGIAETLNHMGWVSFLAGDMDRADALSSEALALHEKRGDTRGVALSLTNLGASAMQRGDLHRARTLHERGLALRRSHKDPRSIAYGRVHLGWTLMRLGIMEEGLALAREAEQALRALGDKQIVAFSLFIQGEAALERGRADEALPLFEESVALGREIMQGASLGLALAGFAEALALTGDLARAIECSDEGLFLHQTRRTKLWSMFGLRGRAEARRLAGDVEEARHSYHLALQYSAASGLLTYASQCLAGLAALDSQMGRHDRALRLAAAAHTLWAHTSAAQSRRGPDLDRIEALALQHLAEHDAARARAEGAAVDLNHIEAILS